MEDAMRKKAVMLLLSLGFVMASILPADASPALSGTVKFCVFSDPHYYDPSLGVTGSAFEEYLAEDRKMIAESEAILESAIKIVEEEHPSFLIIPGDLTKDGEKVCHEKFAMYLKTIEDSGIQVYVVPGNHDVLNSSTCSYSGDTTTSIPNVTASEFASIYSQFGYGEAIARDPNSLSYIVEPVPGLWLFALDACKYSENTATKTYTGGKFSTETLNWVESKLKEAKSNNKMAIGMMHHGILEHYSGQKQFFGEYVVDDYTTVSELFAHNGMQFVFTGHYHAQDITSRDFSSGERMYDIETGSLVTAPCPVRTVNISTDLQINISTRTVETINYDTGGKSFPQYAQEYLLTGMEQLVTMQLTAPVAYGGYGISAETAAQVAPSLAQAFVAHYAGDEKPSTQALSLAGTLLASSDPSTKLIGQMLGTLWTDLLPNDNTLVLDTITEVNEKADMQPTGLLLMQNYPNPFNPSTTIEYTLNRGGHVNLSVFNITGQKVGVLVDREQTSGRHSITFDASSLPSGVYFYRLTSGTFSHERKMTMVK